MNSVGGVSYLQTPAQIAHSAPAVSGEVPSRKVRPKGPAGRGEMGSRDCSLIVNLNSKPTILSLEA